MRTDLARFFQSYQRGFDTFDAAAIASHYHVPATISDADGLHSYVSTPQLIAKFEANCAYFRNMGYVAAQFTPGLCHNSGDTAITVDLGWSIRLDSNTRNFRTTYMCVLVKRQWKIVTAIVYQDA